MLKRVLVGALLIFAAATLLTFIYRELRIGPEAAAPKKPDDEQKNSADAGRHFRVYSLHANFRCVTCKLIEAQTDEALRSGFAEQIADGSLRLFTENFEKPGNEYFGKDFEIVSASVLLVEQLDGKAVRWKNLDKIWELVFSKEYFIEYIQTETKAFLQGEGGKSAVVAGDVLETAGVGKPESEPLLGWEALLAALATALGLGLMTAISPCPLATNVAAISFIGKRVGSPGKVLVAGLLYSLGRTLAYILLGAILVAGLLSAPGLSAFFNKYINSILGPLLIVVGLFLLQLVRVSFGGGIVSTERLQRQAEKGGLWSAALLGILFALAFCPTSAALFFGALVPLSVKAQSSLLLPGVYGIATGLPVIGFAVLIALASNAVGKWFNRLSQIELWMRFIAGGLFILVGIYYCLTYVFRVL